MPVEVRLLTEADAQAWWDVRREALASEPFAFGKTVEEHEQVPLASIAERFRNTTADSFTLGAFHGDDHQLAGLVTFARNEGAKERHKGWIYSVFVRVSARGQGVGRALLAALFDRVRLDPSIEQLHLAVGTHNEAANALYRGFGFETYGLEPNSLKIGDEYEAEEHMWVNLRSEPRRMKLPAEPVSTRIAGKCLS